MYVMHIQCQQSIYKQVHQSMHAVSSLLGARVVHDRSAAKPHAAQPFAFRDWLLLERTDCLLFELVSWRLGFNYQHACHGIPLCVLRLILMGTGLPCPLLDIDRPKVNPAMPVSVFGKLAS